MNDVQAVCGSWRRVNRTVGYRDDPLETFTGAAL